MISPGNRQPDLKWIPLSRSNVFLRADFPPEVFAIFVAYFKVSDSFLLQPHYSWRSIDLLRCLLTTLTSGSGYVFLDISLLPVIQI